MDMKFALAAGVCAASLVGFSDVTSANVVGYLNGQSPSSGNIMLSGSFITVGQTETFKLSDIRGTAEDAMGTLNMTLLGPGGTPQVVTQEEVEANPALANFLGMPKTFYWYDCEWAEKAAGWYDGNGDLMWPADTIMFKAGDSFWTLGYGEGFSLSGQVGKSNVNVTTPSSGNIAVGNPFPVAIKLSSLYGTAEDAMGTLNMTLLGPGGTPQVVTQEEVEANPALANFLGMPKTFYWYDCEWAEKAAGWYDGNGDLVWPADTIYLPAGQGLWALGYGEGFVIPAPDAVK